MPGATMKEILQNAAMRTTDVVQAAVPRQTPHREALRACKIVAHRGAHGGGVRENTMAAFQLARSRGVWGIECDIRWSADLEPVIHHDPDTRRVFGHELRLDAQPCSRLQQTLPELPTLAEVELKAGSFPDPSRQRRILQERLAALEPGRDYHLLALDPALFELADFVPRRYCLPVSELAVARLSAAAIAGGFGGLLGHFLLLNERIRQRHARAGQPIGTGFVASKNCLFRELNRGVEWVFSNEAVKLQQIVEETLEQA
jgi:glycerophosphoryl diester phosphodiesterase